MGKKNQAKEKKREELERRREERRENITNRKSLAKERRKRQYNRAEDKEWQTNFDKFSLQLKTQGLMIHDVAGDGNCLFRSISDQLYGDATRHIEVRQQIMDHIENNPDNFQPFIEDDEPFEKYIKSMRKLGTWGGNIELQAASVLFHVNVHIYQLAQPRWDVINHPPTVRVITLSYHDGEHYNSVKPLPAGAAVAPTAISSAEKSSAVPAAKKASVMDKAERSKQFKEQAKQLAKTTGSGAAASEEPTEEELALMQALELFDLQAIRAMMNEEPSSSSSLSDISSSAIAADTSTCTSSAATASTPAPAASSQAPLIIPEDENEQLALALSLSTVDVPATTSSSSSSAPAPAATSSLDTEKEEQAEKDNDQKKKDPEEDEAERARRQHEKNMQKLAAKSGHMSNQRRKQIAKQEREAADKARKRERQLTKAAEKAQTEKAAQLGIAPANIPPGVPLEAFQAMRI